MPRIVISAEQLQKHRKSVANTLRAAELGLADELLPVATAFYRAEDESTRSIFRQRLIEIVYTRIERYRAVMTLRAHDFCLLTDPYDNTTAMPFPVEAVDARVRSAAHTLFDDGDINAYVEVLKNYVLKEVNSGRFEA